MKIEDWLEKYDLVELVITPKDIYFRGSLRGIRLRPSDYAEDEPIVVELYDALGL